MKNKAILVCILAIIFGSLPFNFAGIILSSSAQDSKETQNRVKTLPEHDILKQFAGNWDEAWSFTPEPGAEPLKGKGILRNKMLLGSLILMVESESEFDGKLTQSLYFLGYDSHIGKYFFRSYDEDFKLIQSTTGDYDVQTKRFLFKGYDKSGINESETDLEIHIILFGNDKYIIETYLNDGDVEYKSSESVYTKK